MSRETWIDEFYALGPNRTPSTPDLAELSPVDNVKHALRKWRGLRKKNLERHGVYMLGTALRFPGDFEDFFFIDADTCSCCAKWYHDSCTVCPLLRYSRGWSEARPCFRFVEGSNPYMAFVQTKDPQPMIILLVKALAKVRRRKGAKLALGLVDIQKQATVAAKKRGHNIVWTPARHSDTRSIATGYCSKCDCWVQADIGGSALAMGCHPRKEK